MRLPLSCTLGTTSRQHHRALRCGHRSTKLGWWTLCLSSSLVIITVEAVSVEWRISNAWTDASCDSVCWEEGMDCTELCWPSTAEGLESINRAPGLRDICFAVTSGEPAPWHPAKDPQNTLCYWNAGPPQYKRCPTVPQTPPEELENNRLIRRFCPCFNRTAGDSGIDCGMRDAPVAVRPPAPSPKGAATVETTTLAPGPAPTTRPASSRWSCKGLCVRGFSGTDAGLNGGYARIEVAGVFARWSRQGTRDGGSGYGASLQIVNTNGRWRFIEVDSSGTELVVAEAAKYAAVHAEKPAYDRFSAADGDHQVRFSCCGSGSDPDGGLGSSGRSAGASDVTTIVLACLGGFAFLVILGTMAYLRCWKYAGSIRLPKLGRKRRRAESAMPEAKKFKPEDLESGPAAIGRDPSPATREALKSSAREQPWSSPPMPPMPSNHQGPASATQQSSAPWSSPPPKDWFNAPDRPAHNRMETPPPTRNKFGSPLRNTAPATSRQWAGGDPSTPSTSGIADHTAKDRSAAAVAAALGGPLNGVYEGPVKPWWQDNSAVQQPAPIIEKRLPAGSIDIGDKVRLKGMDQLTWNGTDCVVEDFDDVTGLVHVKLPDGRLKAVRLENIERPAVPARPTEQQREKARMQMSATFNAESSQARPEKVQGRTGRSWRNGGSSPSRFSRGHDTPEQGSVRSGGARSSNTNPASAAGTFPGMTRGEHSYRQDANDSDLRATAGAPRSFGPAAGPAVADSSRSHSRDNSRGAGRSFGPSAGMAAPDSSRGKGSTPGATTQSWRNGQEKRPLVPPAPPSNSNWWDSGGAASQAPGPAAPSTRQSAAAAMQLKGPRPPVPPVPGSASAGQQPTSNHPGQPQSPERMQSSASAGRQRTSGPQSPVRMQERRSGSFGPQPVSRVGASPAARTRASSQDAVPGLESDLMRAQRGMQVQLDGLKSRLGQPY